MARFLISEDESEEDSLPTPRRTRKDSKSAKNKSSVQFRHDSDEEYDAYDDEELPMAKHKIKRSLTNVRRPQFTPNAQSFMAGASIPYTASIMMPQASPFMPCMPMAQSFMQPQMMPQMMNPYAQMPPMMPMMQPAQMMPCPSPYMQPPMMGDGGYSFEDDYEQRQGKRPKKNPMPLLLVGLLIIVGTGCFLFKDQIFPSSEILDEEA